MLFSYVFSNVRCFSWTFWKCFLLFEVFLKFLGAFPCCRGLKVAMFMELCRCFGRSSLAKDLL